MISHSREIPEFYEILKFITVFKSPAIASYPEPDQAVPCLSISRPEGPFKHGSFGTRPKKMRISQRLFIRF